MIRIIKIVVLSFFAIFANQLAAQSSPVPMLKQTAQQIIGSLKNHQGALHHDPKIVHQAIRTYLLPHIDVEGMSRSVLGRQAWMKATSAREKQPPESLLLTGLQACRLHPARTSGCTRI